MMKVEMLPRTLNGRFFFRSIHSGGDNRCVVMPEIGDIMIFSPYKIGGQRRLQLNPYQKGALKIAYST